MNTHLVSFLLVVFLFPCSALAGAVKSLPVSIRVTSNASTNTVPVIVAQGYIGRTTISCDDGKSWIADRSFDIEGNAMVCGNKSPVICGVSSCYKKESNGNCTLQSVCDCGHDSGYGKGIVIAKNQILANFGWGGPGVILRSVDGQQWNNSYNFDASYLYPNISFNSGRFIHFSSQPHISTDGLSWSNGAFANFNGANQPWTSPRAFDLLQYKTESRLIGVIDGDIMRISSNNGDSWTSPKVIPAGCTDGIGNSQRILTGNDIAVIITSTGKSCRTSDGGETWTLHNITSNELFAYPIFANGKFMTWSRAAGSSNGLRYSSTDGVNWVATPMKTNTWLGAIGVSPTGTLVSTNGIDTGYSSQEFLRSEDDGLTWVSIPQSNYKKSHAIVRFQSGYIAAGGICK